MNEQTPHPDAGHSVPPSFSSTPVADTSVPAGATAPTTPLPPTGAYAQAQPAPAGTPAPRPPGPPATQLGRPQAPRSAPATPRIQITTRPVTRNLGGF